VVGPIGLVKVSERIPKVAAAPRDGVIAVVAANVVSDPVIPNIYIP